MVIYKNSVRIYSLYKRKQLETGFITNQGYDWNVMFEQV